MKRRNTEIIFAYTVRFQFYESCIIRIYKGKEKMELPSSTEILLVILFLPAIFHLIITFDFLFFKVFKFRWIKIRLLKLQFFFHSVK